MTLATRISPNPVWQLLDQNGDVIASINNQGSANVLPGAGPAGGMISTVKLTLTAAQLNALKTTPISILPAPGTGKAYHIYGVDARLLFGTTAFTLNAGTFKLFYGPVANAKAITADLSALLTQTANATTIDQPIVANATLTDAQALNVDIELGNDGGANYTLGDGTLEVVLRFDVVTFP